MSTLVVAVTGASGSIYAQRFLRCAAKEFERVYLMMSDQALQVWRTELDPSITQGDANPERLLGVPCANITVLDRKDYFSPPASGSFRHAGMVVIPCSMGTAGRIANGISDDLVTRAADVCLKEKRPLVLVVRETPLNLIQLRNLTQLAEAGATVMPASPGFYHRPVSIEELVDSVVARVLQHVGVDQRIVPQWQVDQSE